MSKSGVLILMVPFFLGMVALMNPRTTFKVDTQGKSLFLQDYLPGGWSYTAEEAPEGYKKGILLIVQDGDGYKVQVQIGNSTLMGESVSVKKNTIRFVVRIEREEVSVELTAFGSKISGTSTSPSSGVLNINGVKSLSAGQ